ncbi:patatin-like phospholipase family protein, partial [Neisseria gonorrhoeae]
MVTFSKIRSFLAIAAAALLAACGTAGNKAARKPVQTAKPAA